MKTLYMQMIFAQLQIGLYSRLQMEPTQLQFDWYEMRLCFTNIKVGSRLPLAIEKKKDVFVACENICICIQ